MNMQPTATAAETIGNTTHAAFARVRADLAPRVLGRQNLVDRLLRGDATHPASGAEHRSGKRSCRGCNHGRSQCSAGKIISCRPTRQSNTPFHLILRYQRGDKVMATVKFDIRGDRWRVYSSKPVTAAMTGQRRARMEDAEGNVLSTQEFLVTNP